MLISQLTPEAGRTAPENTNNNLKIAECNFRCVYVFSGARLVLVAAQRAQKKNELAFSKGNNSVEI